METKWAICLALPHEIAALRPLLSDQARTTYQGAVFREGEIKGIPVVVAQTGLGPRAAMRATDFLIQNFPITHLLISGYCGALAPDFLTGQGLLADSVLDRDIPSVSFQSDLALMQRAETTLQAISIPYKKGAMVSSSAAVLVPAEKKRLGEQRGALGVDMESAAILAACHRSQKKIASLTVRFVVDQVEDDWSDTQSFIDENAQVKPLHLVRALIKKPRLVLALPGLEQKAKHARKNLGLFLEKFFENL